MAGRKYELASAYVRIMPSLQGVSEAIAKEMAKGLRGGVKEAPIEEDVAEKLADGITRAQVAGATRQLFSSAFSGIGTAIAPLNTALRSTVLGAGQLFIDTLSVGARTAGLAFTASLAAVGTQIAAGGLNRALGINEATAGLKAMGFEGQQFTAIMTAAGNSVDGTAYSMDQAVLAARNFLAAGVPEEKLQGYLQNVGKLADMGTRSYDDISTILQSMAATGIVQGGDMLQLAQAGIPIFTALSESLGVSVAEVKALGSAGLITFDDLNSAIGGIDWDSAKFAAMDVGSAWGNVRAQLSKVGANLWTPIIDKLPSILNDARTFISTFGKTFDFNPIQTQLSAAMDSIATIFDRFRDAEGNLDSNLIKEYVTSTTNSMSTLAGKMGQYKGVIIGALVGISGSYLSTLPIIGPAFAGLTPLVGAFSGVLIQAYQNSENLQNAVKGLTGIWDSVKTSLFTEGEGLISGDDLFKTIGDGLASAILWIQDLISDSLMELRNYMPEIQATVGTIFEYIGNAFSTAAVNGLDGEAVAALFQQVITLFGTYAPLAFEVILTAATMAAQIVQSDWFQGLIGWLAASFLAISQNGPLIQTGLAVAAGIFIGGKLIPVITGIIGFISKFKSMVPAVNAAASAAPAVAGSMKALLLGIGKIALIVGLVVAAMAGIGWLMENTGFMDYVNIFIQELFGATAILTTGIAETLMPLVPLVGGIIQILADTIVTLLIGLVNAFMEPLYGFMLTTAEVIAIIVGAGAQLVDAFSGLAVAGSLFINSIGGLLETLADKGVDAGAGAWAAAEGILALMGAISSGTIANAGGNFINGVVDWATGKEGGSNPLEEILKVVEGMDRLADLAISFPIVFSSVIVSAMRFGAELPMAISGGIAGTAAVVTAALSTVLQQAMSTQQQYLDSNPLTVRINVDDSALKSIGAGVGVGSGTTNVSNRTNNMSFRSSNDALIKTILEDGRGI